MGQCASLKMLLEWEKKTKQNTRHKHSHHGDKCAGHTDTQCHPTPPLPLLCSFLARGRRGQRAAGGWVGGGPTGPVGRAAFGGSGPAPHNSGSRDGWPTSTTHGQCTSGVWTVWVVTLMFIGLGLGGAFSDVPGMHFCCSPTRILKDGYFFLLRTPLIVLGPKA